METGEQVKDMVRQKYSEIALQDKTANASSCCGAGGCSTEVYNIMADDYTQLEGYNPDADLGLGCGLPTQLLKISSGIMIALSFWTVIFLNPFASINSRYTCF